MILPQAPDWKSLETIDFEKIEADILDLAIRFVGDKYGNIEPELAARADDENVIKKATVAINNLLMVYGHVHAFDIMADDRRMADEARKASLTLKKVIELVGSIPERQTQRYVRNRELPNFLFSSHFNDVLNDAVKHFDTWSSTPTGRRPNLGMDLATESAVVVVEAFLGRKFKKDLRTAPGGFVSLDALFVHQILAFLDPKISREKVKSALLNLQSSRKLSGN